MKTSYWRTLPAWGRKLALWILGILLFYAIVGFFILPPIIRAVAVKRLSEALERKVTIQKVEVNPFVPSLSIRRLMVLGKDGQPFISWDNLYINFEVSSVFRKAWTFRKIVVSSPYARAQMNKDYTCNFSDLVKKYSTTPSAKTAKKETKPLLVRVKHLQVSDARLSVADYTVRTPFKRVIGPVYVTISNFCTEADSDGAGWLFGRTDANEYFAWRGNFCLTPLRSAGNAIIFDVTMNKFKPLYQDILNFEIRSGQSGFCANYRFEWSPSNHIVAVTNAAFGMSHFRIGQLGDTNDVLDLAHFAETGVSGNLEAHHGEIGLIKFSEGDVFLRRGTNKSVNLIQIAKPKVRKPAAPGGILVLLNAITNAVATLINTTNNWTGVIHEIDFTNCGAHLLDLAYARPATLDLDNIDVDVKNVSNVPNTNITAGVSMDWNKNGQIIVDATALLSPPTVDARLALKDLDLSTLAPYIEPDVNMLIPSASFGLEGEVHLHTTAHKLPEVRFHGDTWLDDFQAVDGVRGDDFLKWDEIRVSGIDANANPLSASIREILAKNVSAHLIVETNRAINLVEALRPAITNSAGTTRGTDRAKTASTTNAIPPVSIATIAITNAQIRFTDRSVRPNVRMDIQDAGGTITGISSTGPQQAEVDLRALVDGASPADITGRVNPFSGTLTNQISILLTNMDLVPASPYSGKYAGYRIARGALSVGLQYNVAGRKLQSENVITLNQFTFGDKVDSPEATKLPVRLAIDILKDRQGKIVLNVPIDGNLADPKFHIGSVVERALENILVKVATSPFSLLSAAFGGSSGADLSYEDFSPASAQLTDATRKSLNVLIKALYNRPGLQLQISGSVDPMNDRHALQRVAFEKELRTHVWRLLRASQKELITPDQVVITPRERAHWVTKLYDESLASRQITPAMIAASTNLTAIANQIQSPEDAVPKESQFLAKPNGPEPEPEQSATNSSLSRQKLAPPVNPREALLTAIIPVPESQLETLALNRAKAVRSYIVNSGHVDASRLFLAQNPGGTLRQDGSRVHLQLE
ncbi:MAG: DUF748 domain-containing protein [Limisphaerales bacterium]